MLTGDQLSTINVTMQTCDQLKLWPCRWLINLKCEHVDVICLNGCNQQSSARLIFNLPCLNSSSLMNSTIHVLYAWIDDETQHRDGNQRNWTMVHMKHMQSWMRLKKGPWYTKKRVQSNLSLETAHIRILGDAKVSMLSHTCPHKYPRKI